MLLPIEVTDSLWSKGFIVVLTVVLTSFAAWLAARRPYWRVERLWDLIEKAPQGDPIRPVLRAQAAQEVERITRAHERDQAWRPVSSFRRASGVLWLTAVIAAFLFWPAYGQVLDSLSKGFSEGFASGSGRELHLPGLVVLVLISVEVTLALAVLRLLWWAIRTVVMHYVKGWPTWSKRERLRMSVVPGLLVLLALAGPVARLFVNR